LFSLCLGWAGISEVPSEVDEIVIPEGTPIEVHSAMLAIASAPIPQFVGGARPGGPPKILYNSEMERMRELGEVTVPILLANIEHPAVRPQAIQLLSDLRVPETVPILLASLTQEDVTEERFVIGALGRITRHPDAYKFYRFYFHEPIREEAFEAYTDSWEEYQATDPD
jgi:hypothetical protein